MNGPTPARKAQGSGEGVRGRSAPSVLTAAPNALTLLKALQRRWLPAVCLGVLLAIPVAVAVCYFLPPAKHSASIKLSIPADPQGTVFKHPEAGDNFEYFQQTQATMVRSQLVLEAALHYAKPGQTPVAELSTIRASGNPIALLERSIKVDFPGSKEILRITLEGSVPEELKILVDAIAESYLTEFAKAQMNRRQQRIATLEKLLENSQTRLKTLRGKTRQLSEKLGSGDNQTLAFKQQLAADKLTRAQHELVDLESTLRAQRIQEETLTAQQGKDFPLPEKELAALIEKDAEVERLRQRIAEKGKLLEDTRGVAARPDIRSVQKLSQELDQLKKALESKSRQLRPGLERQLRARLQTEAISQLTYVREQIREKQALKTALVSAVEELEKLAIVLNRGTLDLEEYQPEIREAEASRSLYFAEKEKLSVELGDPPRVTRLAGEQVVLVRADELTNKLRFAGAAALGAFALAALGIALLEFRSRRLESVQQVAEGLGMKVVGTVPARPKRLGMGLLGAKLAEEDWHALLADAVDATRTMLLHTTESSAIQAVMVTSAWGGEGKTSFASHLAISLARVGRRTLLLDCDLRNPSAHALFGLSVEPGFAELLRGEGDLEQALRPTAVDGLTMVTAGRCDSKALRLLSQGRVAALLDQFRNRFDFIVIDSSPILPVPDALQVGQYVDGVLFCVLRAVSRLSRVYEASRRVEQLGIPVLGTVVNGTHEDTYHPYGRRYAVPQGI